MPVVNEVLVQPRIGGQLVHQKRILAPLQPGQALVRIEACGVCGSDLFLRKGGFGADKLPVVPGHEAAGRVEAVGDTADTHWVGRQVAIYYIDAPLDGHWASIGAINVGPDVQRMGVDVDGAFARYVVRPISTLIAVYPEMDPVQVAVCTDALATPYHAITAIAGLQAEERVVVIGPGGIGSNAIQIAAMLGARVTVVGRTQSKLDQGIRLGAICAVHVDEGPDAVRKAVGGNVDVVLECSGAPSMARLAIDCAGYRARVVMVGASREPFKVDTGELIWREMSVMGSRGFTPSEIGEVMALVREGRLTTAHVTRDRRPWLQAEAALEDLRAGRTTRTVLIMDSPDAGPSTGKGKPRDVA